MANFCGRCGQRIDPQTGCCPKCDSKRNNKAFLWITAIIGLLIATVFLVTSFTSDSNADAPALTSTSANAPTLSQKAESTSYSHTEMNNFVVQNFWGFVGKEAMVYFTDGDSVFSLNAETGTLSSVPNCDIIIGGIFAKNYLFTRTGKVYSDPTDANGWQLVAVGSDGNEFTVDGEALPYNDYIYFRTEYALYRAPIRSAKEVRDRTITMNGIDYKVICMEKAEEIYSETRLISFGIYDGIIVAIDNELNIMTINPETYEIKTIVDGNTVASTHGDNVIVVDQGRVYFTNENKRTIESVRLDGTDRRNSVIGANGADYSLFTCSDGYIYYVDRYDDIVWKIYRTSVNDPNDTTVLAQGEENGILPSYMTDGLAVIGDWVYYNSRGYWRCKTDGSCVEYLADPNY